MLNERFTFCFKITIQLLFWCFSLCSNFIKFNYEIDKLKSILCKNSYPRDLFDKCIKEFIDKKLAPKPVVITVPKIDLVTALPYLGKLSLQIRTRINRIIKVNSRTVISGFISGLSLKLVNFLLLKTKFHDSYVLALFTSFSMVAAMLPIMAKLNGILRSECVTTGNFCTHWKKG